MASILSVQQTSKTTGAVGSKRRLDDGPVSSKGKISKVASKSFEATQALSQEYGSLNKSVKNTSTLKEKRDDLVGGRSPSFKDDIISFGPNPYMLTSAISDGNIERLAALVKTGVFDNNSLQRALDHLATKEKYIKKNESIFSLCWHVVSFNSIQAKEMKEILYLGMLNSSDGPLSESLCLNFKKNSLEYFCFKKLLVDYFSAEDRLVPFYKKLKEDRSSEFILNAMKEVSAFDKSGKLELVVLNMIKIDPE